MGIRKYELGIRNSEGRSAAVELMRWLDEYYAGRKPTIAEAMRKVGKQYVAAVAKVVGREVGLEELPELGAFVEAYADGYAGRHAGKASKRVGVALDEEDALAALEEELALWDEERPAEMGENESVRMGNGTAKAVYVAAGVSQLRWDSQGSACPNCARLDGMVVGIDEGFGDEAMGSVGHPPLHRGCECQIVAG